MKLQSWGGAATDVGFSTHAPCKLQATRFPSYGKLFLGFQSHNNLLFGDKTKKISIIGNKTRGFTWFKLLGHSKISDLPKKNMHKGKNNKKYGGILPSILRSLEAGSDVESTLDLYYGKLSPKEQTVILKEQRRWDKVLRVFEWFKTQKDYVPNVIHYNVVLRTLGRAQKWDELRRCWIEMSKVGVFPINNTYGMLVDVYGKAGLVREALLWIKHMILRGIFPDEVTMSTVIKVLKDAEEYGKADRFYKDWCVGRIEMDDLDLDNVGDQPFSLKEFLLTELFRTGGRTESLRDSSMQEQDCSVRKPCLTATYNTLIDLYGKAGRLKDATNVFSDMLKSGVALDTFTFNTMIFICGSQGYMSEAEALFSKMEEMGIFPDTKTYNIFLSLYANVGNIDAVFRCYRKIRDTGLFPDDVTHRAFLKILCERNMVQEVEAVIEEMENLKMHLHEQSVPILAKMYVNEGLTERATFVVEKSQSHGWLSSKTYAAIMDVYAEKGLWGEAEALFYAIRDGGKQKEVLEYNVMIKAYGNAKLYDKAIYLFKGMRNQGTWPDECTFNSLIQMLAGGDLVDEARNLKTEMQEAGFKPSGVTFSAIIASLTKKNRLSDAVYVYQEMLRASVKPNEVIYGSLIDAFAEAGKFEDAIHYFNVMEESGISANQIVLTSMIKAYGKIGCVEGAKKLYERMINLDGGPDVVASNSMLNLYAELGMVSDAELLYNYLREKNCADGVTFATMIYVYKNMGMLDEAIEVAEEMKQSGLVRDCVTFNKVMACYSTYGKLTECGVLLHEMLMTHKIIPNGGTFKVLFTVLKKGGISDEAVEQLKSSYLEGKPFAKQAVITSVFSIVGLHAYALESCGTFRKEDVGFNSLAYNAAIRAYVAYGKTDEALKMFMRMQDEGLEPDIVTLISLVNCYGKAGLVEGIKRIYSRLKYGAVEPNESLYKAVIDAYKNCNRHDLAELVTQEMRFAFESQPFIDSDVEDLPNELTYEQTR
ncbi:pentatricopeptide repeat-containing protein [Dorcoceras hygrometricum]|uniref:Pentatricopeptide repeat-containing protein n=1 Tax=Dorcoceras hygrometricum TaxID=472368 RepID=A0A2Z7BG65_9LAMI|nr:pentatricopeptide repeat-containing protein [Dorcoceras hygrometricum]